MLSFKDTETILLHHTWIIETTLFTCLSSKSTEQLQTVHLAAMYFYRIAFPDFIWLAVV